VASVSVNVTVRDLTRAEVARIRRNFQALGQDLEQVITNRTRQNFDRLGESIRTARTDLVRLRGAIPDDEFFRLDTAIREAQDRFNRGFGRATTNNLNEIGRRIRDVRDSFSQLADAEAIRIRVDTSALQRADAQLARWREQQERNDIRIRARADIDSQHFRRSVLRFVAGPLRGAQGLIGGVLSDGIGQGIIGAFKSPAFGVLLVAAIVAALAAAGAAIAGALVLALGGAFVGIAAMSAAKSDEVQRNWKAAAKNMGEDLRKAGEPLIPVLHRAVHVLENMSSEFAPHFRKAMEDAVPHLDTFIVHVREGFRKMGQSAWDDLQMAFRVFLDAFGPEFEDFLKEFGDSLGALSRTVSEHSTEIGIALRGALGIINLMIDAVNLLANTWIIMLNQGSTALAWLIRATKWTADGILLVVESIVKGFDFLTSWIPDLDGQLAKAGEAIEKLRGDTRAKFEDMAVGAEDFGRRLDEANKERTLTVNIDSWTSELTRAKKDLESVPPNKQSDLKANISDLSAKISQAQAELSQIKPNYYVRIHGYKTGDWALGLGGPFAHGGVVGQIGRAATGGARSNMTLVGEQGPEIVNLAPGSHVKSNPDSRRMLAQDTGGGSTLVLKSSGRRVDDLLIEVLREAIHQRGGDPVTVLGGR
jgi:hypothetical protein